MKNLYIGAGVWFTIVPLCFSVMIQMTPFQHVDPFIGTGGTGFLYPGAQLPFGMVKLSPDTSRFDPVEIPQLHYGGYYYYDTHIRRFSHLHMVGPGVSDLGNLGIMAVTSPITGEEIRFPGGMYSTFNHTTEKAHPGYYSVVLSSHDDTLAELTSTQHVGVHRYTFQTQSKYRAVLIDPAHELENGVVKNASISVNDGDQEVTGVLHMSGSLSGRFGGFDLFYAIKFSETFSEFGTWTDGVVTHNSTTAHGCGGMDHGIGGYVSFNVDGNQLPVEVFVGISFISLDQARRNLIDEVMASGWKFDDVLGMSQDIWNSALNLIEIETSEDTGDPLVKFYTALYHSMAAPTNYSEAGGVYLGFDREVHHTEDMNGTDPSQGYYSDMSLWDTHRTKIPLFALLRPTIARDIARSLVSMMKQGGDLPRWPLALGYTGCMIGAHATVLLSDLYQKNIQDFDVEQAYNGARLQATEVRKHGPGHVEEYMKYGYVPEDVTHGSASQTLAWAFDDGALAQWAKALGKQEDYAYFVNRSKSYRNIWSDDIKYFCARKASGEMDCPPDYEDMLDPRFVEGDARQWRWFVPADVDGLVELFGPDLFASELKALMDDAKKFPGTWLPNPAYWAGNEPDILAPWMFAFVGRLDYTAEGVRWVMDEQYFANPEGIPGNDDFGTLSAWYVWGGLGLYPLAGTPLYLLGSPRFEKVTLHRAEGDVIISCTNYSPTNMYVQSVTADEEEVSMKRPIITHSQIAQGALLEFVMGSKPPDLTQS